MRTAAWARKSRICATRSARGAPVQILDLRDRRTACADPRSARQFLPAYATGMGRAYLISARPNKHPPGATEQISDLLCSRAVPCRRCHISEGDSAMVWWLFGFGQEDNLMEEEDPCLVARIGYVWLHEQ
ncbi:Uncharacterized protein Adt_24437 [Abeliophyllum distichum]|uniref:Uncharacterized protein n=1 Tax=Abeliophyllum distichum TaxID=126358 RepID=A0ABD1SDQ9_9LAMI